MNVTDEPVILYPRTKLGTFTLFDEKNIQAFDTLESNEITNVNVTKENERQGKINKDDPVVEEILSQIHLNKDNMSTSEVTEITNLLSEYKDVFQTSDSTRGRYSGVKHEIHTGDHPPIKSKPYRNSPHMQSEIRKQVNEMLDQGVIRESTSSWSFPVCIVPKIGTNEYRFAIDFRRLNQISARDNFPLPNISDTFDSLGMSKPKYFTTLDLASGYWQIDVDEASKDKTAFITQDGLFEFNSMPFGLHNAPSTFQRAMQEVLRGLNWKFVLVYLDDIIIYSSTFSEHLQHVRQVFDRLRKSGLKLKAKKCNFGQRQVKFLGHIVSEEGVATDPAKLEIVKNYPTPVKVAEVRSFLGFVGYYRKFIKDFCKIARPLSDLTRKDVPFVWNDDCQNAFDSLKQRLLEPPILAYPIYDGSEFILQTDASHKGLGFILAQKQDGVEKVISYGGRALQGAERNYSITELEALAVVEGIRKYSTYLNHSIKFKVVTDHCALKWIFSNRQTTGRLARWALKLQAYSFEVVHISGRSNSNADALSRLDYSSIQTCSGCNHCPSEGSHPSKLDPLHGT